jgi:rhodanese-related sulfurtransferase
MQRTPDYESITPRELKAKLEAGEKPELLDVREPWEFELARIEGSRLIPLSELPKRFTELDPAAETVVICHYGSRSAYATRALGHVGFQKVLNLEGGLDAYADVDGSVSRY